MKQKEDDMQESKNEMTWQERQEAVNGIMRYLSTVDTKDGNRETELLEILELAAQLVVPGRPVELRFRGSRWIG